MNGLRAVRWAVLLVAGLSLPIEAALDYLEAHPDKTVWVLAFDAPSFPKDSQLNETGALLVLAHPDYITGREPLAWIHRASRVPVVKGAVVPATQSIAACRVAKTC